MILTDEEMQQIRKSIETQAGLDEELVRRCGHLIHLGALDEAVRSAFVPLEERLREAVNEEGMTGTQLANHAFSPTKGPLAKHLGRNQSEREGLREFERLCLWLVEREGYERAGHLGAAGSEQGRDIVAWREGALWAFQCKRVQRFGPKDALAEVEKVLALSGAERPVGLVFLITCDVSVNSGPKRMGRQPGRLFSTGASYACQDLC